jgi:hypothetical protein
MATDTNAVQWEEEFIRTSRRAGEVKFWSNGPLLDLREEAELPGRCIKCNVDVSTPPVSVRLSWIDPRIANQYKALRWFTGLRWIWLANRMAQEREHRHRAEVRLPLCMKHRLLRHVRVVGMIGFFLLTVLLCILIADDHSGILMAFPLITLLAGVAVKDYVPRLVTPVRIDHGLVTLKGCGMAFLRSLPVGRSTTSDTRQPADLAAATLRLTRRK